MAGFGMLKKFTGKTLGKNRKRMQNNNEDEEYMGFGLIDSLIDMRFEMTDTTGMVGSRWKKGESMIGKFLNKQPETWPPAEENGLQYGQRGAREQRRQQNLDETRRQRQLKDLQGIPVKPTTREVEGQIGFLGDIDIGI